MNSAVDLVIFDMAGTTVRDEGQVRDAYTTALAAHGIALAPDELRGHLGASKRPAIAALVRSRRAGADEAFVDAVYATFQEDLERRYRETVHAVVGAEETFGWLRRQSIRVALNTGFYTRIMEAILAALGWDGSVIDCAVSSDEVPEGRPAPHMILAAMARSGVLAPARVIAVGDTPLDLRAGTAAGCSGVVGVLTGAHDAVSLGRVRHTHLIPSVAELPALIESEF